MNRQISEFGLLGAVILFTVYGQLMLKWRTASLGALPGDAAGRLRYAVAALFDPGIASGLFAALLASLCWIVVMARLELSFAYPFMALNFVAVVLLANLLFGEPLGTFKIAGVALIVAGTVLVSRG